MLICYPAFYKEDPEQCTSSVVEWSKDDDIYVWICYFTVLLVLYEIWITSDMGESPTNHSMTFNYTPGMLSCYPGFQKQRAWTVYIISDVVVQGCWYMYGYTIPLLYACYLRHGSHMTGVNHSKDHSMTSNYTKDMLSSYTARFQKQRSRIMYLISDIVVQGCWYMYMDMLFHWFMSVIIWGMDHIWQGRNIKLTT